MKVKLIALPFHWLHPSAPAKYLGCTVSIPAYDPDAPERDDRLVRAARVVSFNAAVGSVGGKRYRGPKLPRTVLIPVMVIRMTWKDFGRGNDLARISLDRLGFRRFAIDDLATKPLARCRGEHVNARTMRKLERIYA